VIERGENWVIVDKQFLDEALPREIDMKKTPKKLMLSRETLRQLAKDDVQEVAGGSCLTCMTGTCGCPGWEVAAEA
jgi:transketolase